MVPSFSPRSSKQSQHLLAPVSCELIHFSLPTRRPGQPDAALRGPFLQPPTSPSCPEPSPLTSLEFNLALGFVAFLVSPPLPSPHTHFGKKKRSNHLSQMAFLTVLLALPFRLLDWHCADWLKVRQGCCCGICGRERG